MRARDPAAWPAACLAQGVIRDLSADLEYWMKVGETRPAVAAAVELEADLRRAGHNGIGFDRLRHAFVGLLGRRGYLVGTPEELKSSISEILNLGVGFDLYDLSQALAAVDAVAAECLNPAGERHLPELTTFVPSCRCGKHPEGGKP